MKIGLFLLYSLGTFAQTGEKSSVLDEIHYKDYKKSECYKEYDEVYQKVVKSELNSLKFKQSLALSTGITFSNPSGNSDWGKEEKSIVNAADYQGSSSNYLNSFHHIYTNVQKKFPLITKDQTQLLIRKGFQSGKFCDHWLFSSRYSANQVSKYIRNEFEKYLIESQERKPAIDDESMIKEELEDSINHELQFDDSSAKSIEN